MPSKSTPPGINSTTSNATPARITPKPLPFKARPATSRTASDRVIDAESGRASKTAKKSLFTSFTSRLFSFGSAQTKASPSFTPHPLPTATPSNPNVSKAGPKSPKASALASALRTPNRARPTILAVGCVAVIVLGSWYGAGLKMKRDEAKARPQALGLATATSESKNSNAATSSSGAVEAGAHSTQDYSLTRQERIYALQGARGRLVFARDDLQRKIGEVEERIKKRRDGVKQDGGVGRGTLEEVRQARN